MTQALVNAPVRLARPPSVEVSTGDTAELGRAAGLEGSRLCQAEGGRETQPHITAVSGGSGPGGETQRSRIFADIPS